MPSGTEDRLLEWLRKKLAEKGLDRLGDDGAVLPEGGPWTVTMDHQIADVHFPGSLDPARVADRALRVNLSDLAAMGAEPCYAFLALSCPDARWARRFLSALLAGCRRFGLELAGGDLARTEKPAAVLTLVGRPVKRGRWVRRGSARPGDRLWLGGQTGLAAMGRKLTDLGASLAGRSVRLPAEFPSERVIVRVATRAVRRHLVPEPQLELGRWLARRRRAAAIDVSDGLALDLHRLCRESRVGADLSLEDLPVAPGFVGACRALNVRPEALMLGGGEDYVLLFAMPPRVRPPIELGCRRVGRITRGEELRLASAEGSRPLQPVGWDHFGP